MCFSGNLMIHALETASTMLAVAESQWEAESGILVTKPTQFNGQTYRLYRNLDKSYVCLSYLCRNCSQWFQTALFVNDFPEDAWLATGLCVHSESSDQVCPHCRNRECF